MSLIPSSLTPASLAARRSNALKSTGPRTAAGKRRVALNAQKGSEHQRRLAAGMRDLGEKPGEFRRLLADLLASYRPATAAEELLVEDLASLRWQRRRCERAQAGLLVQHQDDCRKEGLRSAVTRHYQSWERPAGCPQGGLRGAADATYKFEELKELLDEVQIRVHDGNFSEETRGLLRSIYGENPNGRAASIMKLFDDLAKSHPRAPLYEALQSAMIVCLKEEDDVLDLEEASCKVANAPPARVSYDAWLAPDRPDWRQMLRWQENLDRQIERKTRLLMATQRERQAREDREREMALEAPPSARHSRSRPARPDLPSQEAAETPEDAGAGGEVAGEEAPIAAAEIPPEEDSRNSPKQSWDVIDGKGDDSGRGVKTKLDSEGETEPADSTSDDQASP